jgi:putative transposase
MISSRIPLIQDNKDIYCPVSTKEIVRTEQIWIESTDILSDLCHASKNLWNESNYVVRQLFTQKDKDGNRTGSYMKYSDLDYLIKNKSDNYQKLNGATSQQILKILDRSWKSFFEVIKEWVKNPDKFLGRPKLPGYKRKDGEFLLVFTNQQVKIKDGYLKFPKKLKELNRNIKKGIEGIKTRLDDETNLREVRIIPKGEEYVIEIIYKIEEHQLNLNKENVIGLDFGLRNIVTISNNIGIKPVCIKGGVLKSINQFYNKRLAELKTIYSKQEIIVDNKKRQRLTGPAIQILTNNRNKKIKDVMHKYSRFIIDYCIRHNIGTIIIGHNDNWKQEINLGKRNNQNFIQIPFYQLSKMIEYKGEEIGIDIREQDESHTSKCSFLDEESVEHHDVYVGKRVSRGIFRSKIEKYINADVNGALNIIRKAIPKTFSKKFDTKVDGIEDEGLHPLRIDPLSVNRNVNIVRG